MEKLSSLFVGVVDFFAALLPGAATVGVLLYFAPSWYVAQVRAVTGSENVTIAAALVAAYILGQVMNATGGWVLDWIYDMFYDPERGWFVANEGRFPRLVKWSQEYPSTRIATGVIEERGAVRKDNLRKALDSVAPAEAGNVYQRVRGYLAHTAPAAFEQIERMESEQKFFRTATVATIVIAYAVHEPWLCLVAAFLMTRYVDRRRKTIERAYMLFSFRALGASTARANSLARP